MYLSLSDELLPSGPKVSDLFDSIIWGPLCNTYQRKLVSLRVLVVELFAFGVLLYVARFLMVTQRSGGCKVLISCINGVFMGVQKAD